MSEAAVLQNLAAEKFREIFDKRSVEEIRTLAHTKRLLERFVADPVFREALGQNAGSPKQLAEAYGIAIDPLQIRPLFDQEYASRCSPMETEGWPAVKAWNDYRAEIAETLRLRALAGNLVDRHPLFHSWRQRQIRRINSEIGFEKSMHPLFAFELSAGCSRGCWFCGLSAQRLRGHFPYTAENARLWREMLGQAVDLFGSGAQNAICYWATDPTDNPDYPAFLEDYWSVTGHIPKTTTAAPLRDLEFTRKVMRLAVAHPCLLNRFSILNLTTLNRVHEVFSAEELLRVELVLMNPESLKTKKPVGHARSREQKLWPSGRPVLPPAVEASQSTLSNLCGFRVNLVDRTIQLVAPTRTSERWPEGSRVFGQRSFRTAQEFRDCVEDLIDTHIRKELGASDRLGFRQDLSYHTGADGFELRGAIRNYAMGAFAGARQLGDLIHAGSKTAGEILGTLVTSGFECRMILRAMQNLFDNGLLEEDLWIDDSETDRLAPVRTGPRAAIPIFESRI